MRSLQTSWADTVNIGERIKVRNQYVSIDHSHKLLTRFASELDCFMIWPGLFKDASVQGRHVMWFLDEGFHNTFWAEMQILSKNLYNQFSCPWRWLFHISDMDHRINPSVFVVRNRQRLLDKWLNYYKLHKLLE